MKAVAVRTFQVRAQMSGSWFESNAVLVPGCSWPGSLPLISTTLLPKLDCKCSASKANDGQARGSPDARSPHCRLSPPQPAPCAADSDRGDPLALFRMLFE